MSFRCATNCANRPKSGINFKEQRAVVSACARIINRKQGLAQCANRPKRGINFKEQRAVVSACARIINRKQGLARCANRPKKFQIYFYFSINKINSNILFLPKLIQPFCWFYISKAHFSTIAAICLLWRWATMEN